MTAGVYVTADRRQVVPEGDPRAAFRLHRREAERLGLVAEEPDEKMVRAPADKMVRRRADKRR